MASKCALGSKNLKEKADKLGSSKNTMNAFLIFCKRQRGSVRRKYPSLENREITRVLGEWWASLGNIEKSLYSAFAHQEHKENLIKPHSRLKNCLRMPGGKLKKQLYDTSQPGIIPGKLADESQLGGLSSLLQMSKEPIVEIKPPLPKPLKKRYRDEVYDSAPVVEPPALPPLPIPSSPPPEVHQPKVEENGDENKSQVETSEEDEERLKVWRSHILEENVNNKRTRARACKGQRYREFMWTSYANRRRSNRWELNQDKEENIRVRRIKTANKTDKPQSKSAKTIKTVNVAVKSITEKSNDLINESHTVHSEGIDSLNLQRVVEPNLIKKRKMKEPKVKANSTSNSTIISPTKDSNDNLMSSTDSEDISDFNQSNDNEEEMKNNYSGFLLLATNTTSNHDNIENTKNDFSLEESRKLENGLVGSRKRKARRQEIRRLPPGSIFKGVDVITENDLRKEN